MIILKIAYNDNSQNLIKEIINISPTYPLLKVETFHEELFKERKKAFKLKGGYSAIKTPFAVLINDEDSKPIAAFYAEANTCNIESITKALSSYIVY